MERTEVVKIIRDTYHTEEELKALETLIPELKESEDEKIREWLVDYFAKIGKSWIHREFTCEQIIAYLEKQKAKDKLDRMMPIYNDRDSFESALEKAWKSYNDSGARTVDGCEDDYVECAHAKGFREGYLFGIEKQKYFPTTDKEITGFLATHKQVDVPEKYKTSDWLFEKQKEQKPAEWSEDDKKMLENIRYELGYAFVNHVIDEQTTDYVTTWINSLRPSWKPSEEQMAALKEASASWMNEKMGNAELLQSLYDALKKLM